MNASEIRALADRLDETTDQTRQFGEWIMRASVDVEWEVDDYETTTYLDLGQLGEQNIDVAVSVNGTESADVEYLINEEAPVDASYLRDDVAPVLAEAAEALREAADSLTTGGPTIPQPIGNSEARIAQTLTDTARALALALGYDDGRDDSARRMLGGALGLAGYMGAPAAALGYDPRTVETGSYGESTKTRDLRPGDDITGSTFGRVLTVEPNPDYSEANATGDTYDRYVIVTLDRDGTTNVERCRESTTWNIQPIRLDNRDRADIPPALAPFDRATVAA